MHLRNDDAQVYVPDATNPDSALARTTHLAVGAHQDDIPIMAHHGIIECFGRTDRWFLGVTVTDGAGSPRADLYADFSDDQMRAVRVVEEKKAAFVGDYSAAVLLAYPSSAAKDSVGTDVAEELASLIAAAKPDVVYTHNLADKHDTHVGVGLRTVAAIRRLPAPDRPRALFGCEVWRDLDWMCDDDKVSFDVTPRPNIAAALMGVYDSQISGGKRYDAATAGRRLAHATFSESHAVDTAEALIHAMDLTPLMEDPNLDPAAFVAGHIDRTRSEITDRISRLLHEEK